MSSFLTFCLTFVIAGSVILPVTAAVCEKSAETLLSDHYRYSSVFSLVSDDERDLAVFVQFYRLKKMRGSVYQRIDISHKLLRYELGQQEPKLVSEQGSCEKYFDLEHHRGLIDGKDQVYLYTRAGNGFSVWPKEPDRPIKFQAIEGVDFDTSRFALESRSGLIYAYANKRIYRNSRRRLFTFQAWLGFDDLVAPGKKWNPLHIATGTEGLSVVLNLWKPQAGFKNRMAMLTFDNDGVLIERQKISGRFLDQIHPGPPPSATSLKMSKDKKPAKQS